MRIGPVRPAIVKTVAEICGQEAEKESRSSRPSTRWPSAAPPIWFPRRSSTRAFSRSKTSGWKQSTSSRWSTCRHGGGRYQGYLSPPDRGRRVEGTHRKRPRRRANPPVDPLNAARKGKGCGHFQSFQNLLPRYARGHKMLVKLSAQVGLESEGRN